MKIEIISGSYGWRKNERSAPRLIERGGVCDVDEAEAQRLAALGVAAIVREAGAAPVAIGSTPENGASCADAPDEENGAAGGAEVLLDTEQLQTWSVAQLRALAKDMGIDTAKCKTKAQLIDTITAEDVIPGEEGGDSAPPEIAPKAPVV